MIDYDKYLKDIRNKLPEEKQGVSDEKLIERINLIDKVAEFVIENPDKVEDVLNKNKKI